MSDRNTEKVKEVILCGRSVPILLRKSKRARKITLRVDPTAGGTNIVMPTWASFEQAIDFARSHEVWITNRLASMPQPVPFVLGARIPVEGIEVEIRSHDERKPAILTEDALYFSGDPEHIPRRTTDWLRKRAKMRLSEAVKTYEKILNVRASRIAVRDTVSRWGSCSSSKTLSFSWRLILAPPEILEYVAAHETAHLIEMNHSSRFWALVDQCVPDRQRPENWLRSKGPLLHGYGRNALSATPSSPSRDLTELL